LSWAINRATAGGGMSNLGQLTVVRSKVVGNNATKSGGGIGTRGKLSLIDVVFADNSPDNVASG
jgi:predicted outer membrane repeat protein